MNVMDDRKIYFIEIYIDVIKIFVLIRVNNFLNFFIVINLVNCRMIINVGWIEFVEMIFGLVDWNVCVD